MKKNLFTIVLFVFAAVAWGGDKPETCLQPPESEIDLKEVLVPPPSGPRSDVKPIHAWYIQDLCMIHIEIDSPQGLMVVSIEDESEFLMLQQIVDGDLPVVDIFLPVLAEGYYKITIRSSAHCLAGVFEVY